MTEKSSYRGDKVYTELLEDGVEIGDEVCFDKEVYFEHTARFSHLERAEVLVLNITLGEMSQQYVYTLKKKTGGILFIKHNNLYKNRLYRRVVSEAEKLMRAVERQEKEMKEKPIRRKVSHRMEEKETCLA